MSVIVAVVSERDGVVASDGRRLSSAVVSSDGKVEKPSIVESDAFDKTFALEGGKVIGAFCGLVEFSGRTAAQHIAEIAGPVLPTGGRFQSVVEHITQELARRISQIDPTEVIPSARILDLILVGGELLTRSELRIASVRFDQGGIYPQRHVKFCRAGEDAASAAAGEVLKSRYVGKRSADFLERVARDAIKAGVRASGPHKYGSDRACGGSPFCRRTRYS